MKVGFIGLGHIGGPMSRHVLAAGHDCSSTIPGGRRRAGLEAAGAAWAATSPGQRGGP